MPAHRQNKKSVWLTFITVVILLVLSACATVAPASDGTTQAIESGLDGSDTPPVIPPTETSPAPTATPQLVTATEILLEPALRLIGQPHSELPVHPPVFEIQDNNLELAPQEDRLVSEYAQWYQLYKSLNPDAEELTGVTAAEVKQRFEQAMEQFKADHPEISVIQEVSPDGKSVVTLLFDTERNELLLHFTKDGVLAYSQPGMFDPETVVGRIPFRTGSHPELVYNPDDGYWYVFRVVDGTETPTSVAIMNDRVTLDNLDSMWMPFVQGELLQNWSEEKQEWVFPATEYEGTFSEKYPPSFKAAFEYKHPDYDISVPVNYGISKGTPVKELYLADEGFDFIGRAWLAGCYDMYVAQHEQISFDDYLKLVEAGKGSVVFTYLDEKTGKISQMPLDPGKGYSLTMTNQHPLPLKVSGAGHYLEGDYYITANKDGMPIIVVYWDERFLSNMEGRSRSFIEAQTAFLTVSNFLTGPSFLANLTPTNALVGGRISKEKLDNTELMQYKVVGEEYDRVFGGVTPDKYTTAVITWIARILFR